MSNCYNFTSESLRRMVCLTSQLYEQLLQFYIRVTQENGMSDKPALGATFTSFNIRGAHEKGMSDKLAVGVTVTRLHQSHTGERYV